jgi:UDP-N-acetylmuramate dehydrogenase
MDQVYQKLKSKLPSVERGVLLAPFTTFKIGGPAKYFFVAKNNKEIYSSVRLARELDIGYFILGGGSNVLISDKGFDGLVLKMQNNHISQHADRVTAESGVPLQKLVQFSVEKKLSGLEHLTGIPGTVGGAVAGNAGTNDVWIDKHIENVEFLNAQNSIEAIPKSRCDFSYRSSRFKYDSVDIILSATWKLIPDSSAHIRAEVKKFASNRSSQPASRPSAGSIFKNPPGGKAWQLIDQAGLRGKQIGDAKVSEQHCNFIINTGHAKAEDVVILISLIKQQIRDTLGFQMQEEIKYIGF